jgi:hypothetical protein
LRLAVVPCRFHRRQRRVSAGLLLLLGARRSARFRFETKRATIEHKPPLPVRLDGDPPSVIVALES